jgi:hypothetical protein
VSVANISALDQERFFACALIVNGPGDGEDFVSGQRLVEHLRARRLAVVIAGCSAELDEVLFTRAEQRLKNATRGGCRH